MPTISTGIAGSEVDDLLSRLPALIANREYNATSLLTALGLQALSLVKEAFIVKARGGTDEAGIKWAPLSKKYIAYGRRHPGLSRIRGRAAAKGRSGRPLLTSEQDKLWRGIYRSTLAAAMRSGLSQAAASGAAAGRAWAIVKAKGGKTILGQYGNTTVEIGRDTGRLYNSLSPGSSDNFVKLGNLSVTVGTNVKYAAPFHARRPIWPAEGQWPKRWLELLSETLTEWLTRLLKARRQNG